MNSLMVLFFMSNKCNRQCDCCYARLSGEIMSEQVTKDAGNWVSDTCESKGVEHLHIHLAGGEPTTNVENVFLLQDVLNERLPQHQMKIFFQWNEKSKTFHYMTNGDLFTDEMLREFKHRKIGIKLNPCDDSLKLVEDKVIKIKEICGGVTLAIALDDLNMARLPELTKLAVKYKAHLRINRLYDGGNIPGYVEEFRKQMSKMFDILLAAEWTMWPNWIMESTFPTWKGKCNPYSCGKWWGVIDVDGTVRGCNPDYDTKVGSIYTHKWDDLKFPQRWSAKNIPECQGCEWITICQGGCPYTRKLTYGTYDHKSPFCSAFKHLFPKVMLLKDKWEKNYART